MAKKKKKRKSKTIGEITNSRGKWFLNPVTKIKRSEKLYKRKNKNNRGDEQ